MIAENGKMSQIIAFIFGKTAHERFHALATMACWAMGAVIIMNGMHSLIAEGAESSSPTLVAAALAGAVAVPAIKAAAL